MKSIVLLIVAFVLLLWFTLVYHYSVSFYQFFSDLFRKFFRKGENLEIEEDTLDKASQMRKDLENKSYFKF